MNEGIFHTDGIKTELFSAESSKTFFIYKSLKRMKISDKNVNSHIKFITI